MDARVRARMLYVRTNTCLLRRRDDPVLVRGPEVLLRLIGNGRCTPFTSRLGGAMDINVQH